MSFLKRSLMPLLVSTDYVILEAKIDSLCKNPHDHHTPCAADRIVSVSQPFVRPIVRGKAGRPAEFGAKLDIPALGHPKKGETRDKARDYRDECERVEVERRFSTAKRKCGLGLVTAKLRETAAHVIAMSVLVLNLRKIQRALLRLLAYLMLVNIRYCLYIIKSSM